MIDLSGIRMVEVNVPEPLEPRWKIAINTSIASELELEAIKALEIVPASQSPFTYRSERDAQAVAVLIMSKVPVAQVFISPNDPAFGPAYAPLAKVVLRTEFTFDGSKSGVDVPENDRIEMLRVVGMALMDLRREKVLNLHDQMLVYERIKNAFGLEDWHPPSSGGADGT